MKSILFGMILLIALSLIGCSSDTYVTSDEKIAFLDYLDYMSYYCKNGNKDETKFIKIPAGSFVSKVDITIRYESAIIIYKGKSYFIRQ